MELNGWASSHKMLRRYGASARNARVRCHYDHIIGQHHQTTAATDGHP
jgi:hypothetical protein